MSALHRFRLFSPTLTFLFVSILVFPSRAVDVGVPMTWGNNSFYSLGFDNRFYTPQQAIMTDVLEVSAGYDVTVALKADGTVWAWGRNGALFEDNSLGVNRSIPEQINSLTDITSVSGGWNHWMALDAAGYVWTWGSNYYGQLGDKEVTMRFVAGRVGDLPRIASVSAGRYFSLAVTTGNTVYAWGQNAMGQLGDGTTEDRLTPVKVPGLPDIVQVSAGRNHSLALDSHGGVWAWGANDRGQLGDGTNTDRTSPVRVSGLAAGIAYISAGADHSLAVTATGGVKAWGSNSLGQLGDGTYTDRNAPVNVLGNHKCKNRQRRIIVQPGSEDRQHHGRLGLQRLRTTG